MPWKKCPFCEGLSYSAATNYALWLCPYCKEDISGTEEYQPHPDELDKTDDDKESS